MIEIITMPWCHSPQTDWLLWIEQLLGARFFIVFLGSPKEVRCIHFCHRYSAVEWDERGVFAAADLLGTINTILSSGEGEMLTIFMFKRLAHIVASTYYLLWDEVACKVFVKKWSVLDLPIKSPWNSWLVVWNMFYVSIYWEFHHPNWRTPSFFRGVGWNHQPDICTVYI